MDYDDDSDSHDAWQQQQLEERRMAEEREARHRAEHPEYYVCAKHPERPVLDPGVCTLRCCQECYDAKLAGYADYHIKRGTGTWRDWEHSTRFDNRYYSDNYQTATEGLVKK